MKIIVTQNFEKQMQDLLDDMLQHNPSQIQSFKMYLDTILLNMPTKAAKYKTCELFEQEDEVQEIVHEGYKIPFYHDKEHDTFILLGIINQ